MIKGSFKFLAGLIIGAFLGATAVTNVGAQIEEIDPTKIRSYVLALENVIVSLAVDTERSAIGVADLDGRMRQVERRLVELEARIPAKSEGGR